MRLSFLWTGKTKDSWLDTGIKKYVKNIRHYISLEIIQIRGTHLGRKPDPEQIRTKEAAAMIKAMPRAAFVIALDVKGRKLDSPGLADLLSNLESRGIRDVVMVTGGPFGLSEDLLKKVDLRLSLSPMTFTHDMSRLILAEQVYRACTIRAGEPYHH